MITEDDVGRGVRKGTITVDQAVDLFADSAVCVYPEVVINEGSETWQDVEHLHSGSTLFADLQRAGATDEQMFMIGSDIERLRALGQTITRVYGKETPTT